MAYYRQRVKFELIIIACLWFAFGPAICACPGMQLHDHQPSIESACCPLEQTIPTVPTRDCDDCLKHHPLHRGESGSGMELGWMMLSQLPVESVVGSAPMVRVVPIFRFALPPPPILALTCRLNR
jgi:hypothetical protein